jgi:hypothetical protein
LPIQPIGRGRYRVVYTYRIHAKNGSKNSRKKWLEAEDIEQLLNEGLIPNIQWSIMDKLTSEKGKFKPFPKTPRK